MDIFIGEQFTALYEGFQNAEIYFLIRPFALPEKGGAFILFGEDTDFRLTLFLGIVAPPSAERGKLHRAFAGKQKLPEILLADFLKHLAHIIGQIWLDALVCQTGCATGDDRIVFRHKAIPKAEHIIRNRVNRFSGRLFTIRRLFFDNTEGDQVFHIGGANICAFPDLSGNLRHTRSAGGNRRDDRIVERRFPHLLLEQVFRFFKQGGVGIQECVFNIVLNTQLVVPLKQILGCAADDAVYIGFFFRRILLPAEGKVPTLLPPHQRGEN